MNLLYKMFYCFDFDVFRSTVAEVIHILTTALVITDHNG